MGTHHHVRAVPNMQRIMGGRCSTRDTLCVTWERWASHGAGVQCRDNANLCTVEQADEVAVRDIVSSDGGGRFLIMILVSKVGRKSAVVLPVAGSHCSQPYVMKYVLHYCTDETTTQALHC
jgi:hypothetical protein